MRIYIIQFLLIILLACIFGFMEYINADLMLMIYRGTLTYVVSKKLAILINRMECAE